MKKFESGHDLAKEIGCSADVLKKTCELDRCLVGQHS